MTELKKNGMAFSELIIEVFRANRLFLDLGDEMTKPVGLSSARWQVLGVVEHGPETVAHVARLMGLTRQSVQQTADGLARDGLVEYVNNPFHRRAMRMKITNKGAKALAYVARKQAAWANKVGDLYTLQELQEALNLLQKIRLELVAESPDSTGSAKEE